MNIRKAIVSGLGTGYLPAGGTWGSLGACAVFLGAVYGFTAAFEAYQASIQPAYDGSGIRITMHMHYQPTLALLVSAVVFLVAAFSSLACVGLGRFAEQAYGRKDPPQCTIDEWAGQSVALFLLPLGAAPAWAAALVAFASFRLLDITKPPPARRLEKLPFGWGVLLDDLAVGVYANIFTQVILRLGWQS